MLAENVSIDMLSVKDDDVIVLTFLTQPTPEEIETALSSLSGLFPDNRILLANQNFTLHVLTPADLRRLGFVNIQ